MMLKWNLRKTVHIILMPEKAHWYIREEAKKFQPKILLCFYIPSETEHWETEKWSCTRCLLLNVQKENWLIKPAEGWSSTVVELQMQHHVWFSKLFNNLKSWKQSIINIPREVLWCSCSLEAALLNWWWCSWGQEWEMQGCCCSFGAPVTRQSVSIPPSQLSFHMLQLCVLFLCWERKKLSFTNPLKRQVI